MALKLIETVQNTTEGHKVKVYWDREWEEYRVKHYRYGDEYLGEGTDYHTDDKSDAQHHARAWAWHYGPC